MGKQKDFQNDMYSLTINNPESVELTHEKIQEILTSNFKTLDYFCMADEMGSCYHTHLFIYFKSRVRFSTVKRHFPTAHIEGVKGTVSDNVNYIQKTGKWENSKKHGTQVKGTFQEFGTRPADTKGKRSDLTELYKMIVDGLSNAEIIARNQDYILQIDKLDKTRTTILMDKYKRKRRLDLKVIYISGDTGTGKTRYVLDTHGDENVYRINNYQHPFDGYSDENVILFDEYRSNLPLGDMLTYLDVYSAQLPARYNNKLNCYETVYIISNWALEEQYEELQKKDPATWKAFLRRIHEVMIFTKEGRVKYNSADDYLNRNGNFHKPTREESAEIPFLQSTLTLDKKVV